MGRRDTVWQNRTGGYIETTNPLGYDVLINGTNKYLNFGSVSGTSGYGFRDNNGTMEFKDAGGAWAAFGSGGGGTPGGALTSIQYNNAGAFGGFGTWDGSIFTVGGDLSGASLFATNSLFLGAVGTEIKSTTLGVWTIAEDTGNEANFDVNNITVDRTYTLPDATGTIALTSDLSSYVPYTGATTNVDLGTNSLTTQNITINGTITASKFLYDGVRTITFGEEGLVGTFTAPSATTTNIGGGSVLFSAGAGNGSGQGGGFSFEGGAGGATGQGGGFDMLAGQGGTGQGGSVFIEGGNSSSFMGGEIYIKAGAAQSGNNLGGSLTIGTGRGRGTGAGGTFLIELARNGAGTSHGDFIIENQASGYWSYLNFNNIVNDDRTFTFPDATGTIALTSDLSSYLPLSGGTLTGALTISNVAEGLIVSTTATKAAIKLNSNNYTQILGNGSELNIATLGTTKITFTTNSLQRASISTSGLFIIGAVETSAGVALKRSSTELQVRLADDSGYAPIQMADTTINGNLTVDTNTFFVDATNNRVGIGTITPSSQLTIKGATDATFEVAGSTAGRRGLFTYNNAPAVFELDVDTNFRLKTGSSYAMFATNGQVIIGSVGTPIGTLRVPIAPTASANYGVVNLGSGAFDGATAGFFTGNAQGTVLAVNSASGTANLIDLQLAGAKRFAVLSTGFVRIGTGLNSGIDPQGNTGYMFYNSTAPTTGTSAYGFFGRKVTATTGTVTHMDLMGDIASSNGTGFAAGAGSANWRGVSAIYEINNSGVQSGTATGIFLNATETALNSMTHNLMDLQVGGVSKFKVTNAGALTVASNLTVDTNTFFVDATNNRVGILTTSPNAALDVRSGNITQGGADSNYNLNLYGSTYAYFGLNTSGTGKTSVRGFQFGLEDTGTYAGANLILRENQDMRFWTNNTVKATLTAGGLLAFGDGTTSSYPALKRSTTGLQVRLADDSASTWVLSKKLVEANTAGSGSPNILTEAETGTVLTNEGTTAVNYHTLPTAVAGLTFTFIVQDADGIRVTANTGDDIVINGVASTTAGYAESTTQWSTLTLTAINATTWVATSSSGTWTLA